MLLHRLRRSLLIAVLVGLAAPGLAQPDLPFATFAQFTDSLATIGAIADAGAYLCRLSAGDHAATRLVTLLP